MSKQRELDSHHEVFDDVCAKVGGGAHYAPWKGHARAIQLTGLAQAAEPAGPYSIAHKKRQGRDHGHRRTLGGLEDIVGLYWSLRFDGALNEGVD